MFCGQTEPRVKKVFKQGNEFAPFYALRQDDMEQNAINMNMDDNIS